MHSDEAGSDVPDRDLPSLEASAAEVLKSLQGESVERLIELAQAFLAAPTSVAADAWLQEARDVGDRFVYVLFALAWHSQSAGRSHDAQEWLQYARKAAGAVGSPQLRQQVCDFDQRRLRGQVENYLDLPDDNSALTWLRAEIDLHPEFVQALLQHLGNVRLSFHPMAGALALRVSRAADTVGTINQRAWAALLRGHINDDGHASAPAEADYEMAAQLFEQLGDDGNLGLAHTRAAQATLARGRADLAAAADLYEMAAQLFEQLGDAGNLGLANVRLDQGDLARRGHNLADAAEYYVAAARIYEQIHDNLGLANTRLAQGNLAWFRRDLAGAAEYYETAGGLFAQIQNVLGLANVRKAQGDLAERRDDLTAADEFYETAASLYEQISANLGLANTRLAQGDVARRRDDQARAAKYYATAAQLYEYLGDEGRLGLANTRKVQGDLAERGDDLTRAAEYFEQAAALYEQIREPLGLANTRLAQGDLAYKRRDDPDGATGHYQAALQLYEEVQGTGGIANTLRGLGDVAVRSGDVAAAAEYYDNAAALYEQLGWNLGLANTRNCQGNLAERLDDLAGAARYYQAAATLYELVGDEGSLGLANTHLAQGNVAKRIDDVAGAAEHYESAATLYEQLHRNLGLANARRCQGELAQALDNLEDAAAYYEIAAGLYQQVQNDLGLANTRRVQGEVAQLRGYLSAAAEYYETAAKLYEQIQDNVGLATTRLVQGTLAMERGDPFGAGENYEAAAVVFEQVHSNIGLASTRKAQGDLALFRSDLAGAADYFEIATSLYERVSSARGVAVTSVARGELALRRDDLAGASEQYATAARLYQQAHDTLGLANVRRSQADLAIRRWELGEAADYCEAATGLYEQIGNDLGLANAQRVQGDLAQFRCDLPEAARLYALALNRITVAREPIYTTTAALILERWSGVHMRAGRFWAAWLRSHAALRLYQDHLLARQTLSIDRDRIRRGAAQAVGIAVACALQLAGSTSDEQDAQTWRLRAWQVVERHRSAVLLSLFAHGSALRTERLRPEEGADPSLHVLLEQLASVEVQLRDLMATLQVDDNHQLGSDWPDPELGASTGRLTTAPPQPDQIWLAGQIESRQELEARRRDLLRQLRSRSERLATAAGDLEPSFDRILEILQQQQAGVVSYALLPDDTFTALVLRPDGFVQHVTLGSVSNTAIFETLVDQEGQHRFRRALNPRQRRAFERLGQDVWAPLERSGALADLRHVYVVPDGWLRILPFAAISWVEQSGDQAVRRHHLVEEHTITVLLAGGALTHIAEAAQRAQAQPRAPLAAVVDPARASDPVWPPAVEAMRTALAPQIPLEGAVDRAGFVAAVNAGGGLLYLGHGTLGGLQLQDGLFGTEDTLNHLDLHGPVLLGACLLGLEHALEGLAGASTVSALHLVGCPTVLSALWEVQAQGTVELLHRMHEAGGRGPGGWAESLRQAQLELRAQGTDPSVWAAFTLYGSPFA